MASLSISQTVSGLGDNIQITNDYTAAKGIVIKETIAASATDFEIALAFDKDNLTAVAIMATEALTLETNSSSSPATTLSLAKNVPLIYTGAAGQTNPFTAADVTTIFITNPAAIACTLYIKVLEDPTP